MTTALEYERTGRPREALRVVFRSVHLALLALVWYGKIPRLVSGLLVAAYLVYLIAVVLA